MRNSVRATLTPFRRTAGHPYKRVTLLVTTFLAVLAVLLGIDAQAFADVTLASYTKSGTLADLGNNRFALAFTPAADMTVTGASIGWYAASTGTFRVGISTDVGSGEPSWVGTYDDVVDPADPTLTATFAASLTAGTAYYVTVIGESGVTTHGGYITSSGAAQTGGTWGALRWGGTSTTENTDAGFLVPVTLTGADPTPPPSCAWSPTTFPDNRTPGAYGDECLATFAEVTADNTRRIGDVTALGFSLVLFVGGFVVGAKLVP